mmetsp:Transcript_138866/g.252770  ORF Transcript_138866/g.252770 Transcript_138866/m.252770 type:complete len:180 (+) Transcript_138866:106-645(+)
MSLAQPTLVYYYIPGDDDEVEHPNAFTVSSRGNGVKLKDIRAHFPLPGAYHFRFKMKWDTASVWMDVTNEDSSVPIFEEKIIAKVLRLSWDPNSSPGTKGPSAASTGPPAPAPPPEIGVQPGSQPKAAKKPPPPQEVDMLNFGDVPTSGGYPAPQAKAAPNSAIGGGPGKKDDFDMFFS